MPKALIDETLRYPGLRMRNQRQIIGWVLTGLGLVVATVLAFFAPSFVRFMRGEPFSGVQEIEIAAELQRSEPLKVAGTTNLPDKTRLLILHPIRTYFGIDRRDGIETRVAKGKFLFVDSKKDPKLASILSEGYAHIIILPLGIQPESLARFLGKDFEFAKRINSRVKESVDQQRVLDLFVRVEGAPVDMPTAPGHPISDYYSGKCKIIVGSSGRGSVSCQP